MRIITGKAKGIVLKTPAGEATRPTAERVKEAVFSMLQFDIEGRSVLDLFAGSGQMGLEALSRGAQEATFVDKSKEAIKLIKENIEKTYQEINAVYDKIEKLKNIMICPDNLTPLQQDVYLDELTQNFKSDFSAVSWYRSGQGRTPHICFEDVEIYSSGKCQIKVGIYLMLRKSLHIVVKQHLYKSPDNRIKLNEYNKYPEEKQKLLEKQYKLQNSVIKSDWEKKNNDKDKLTILSKPTTDDIKECIADIKDLQQLVSKLKE